MRTIFSIIVIIIFIKVTNIDDVVWPAIQKGVSIVNTLVQKA